MLIVEDPSVNAKHITAIQTLILYFHWCLSVYFWLVSHVHLHPYPFLLQAIVLLSFVSLNVMLDSLMFIYIHILFLLINTMKASYPNLLKTFFTSGSS
jgi:hypothetical protein